MRKLCLSVFALAVWVGAAQAQTRVFDTHTPASCSPNGQNSRQCGQGPRFPVRLVPLAVGLTSPKHLDFLPNGDILVTDAPAIRIIRDDELLSDRVAGFPREALGVRSFQSVLPHPEFERNGLVYVYYIKTDTEGEKGVTLALARGRLDGLALENVEEIFVADTWTDEGGPIAGRAEFGPDGKLYLSSNDKDPNFPYSDDASFRMRSQSLETDWGKVLRVNDDGSIPDDNPFVGRADANAQIYTYGHRNVTGFAWHPVTGELYATEIGPMGGDELNVLEAGANYGWPVVSLGLLYDSGKVSDQSWYQPGIEMPIMYWTPAISPSGITFYTGDRFPQWQGHIFMGALGGQMLQRVNFDAPMPQTQRRDSLFIEMHARFRDVKQGPDGYLYVVTEQRPGPDTGAVYRIEPFEEP